MINNRLIAFCLVMIMCISFLPVTTVSAAGGSCGTQLYWNIDNEGTLKIYGNGTTMSGSPDWTDAEYRSLIKKVEIQANLTELADNVFRNCENLTGVTLPSTLTSISLCAFYGCSSLEEITIPDNVTKLAGSAFYGCSSLKTIKIPDSVTTIGESCFYGCSGLEEIKIPEGITTIEKGSFSGCTGLDEIVIPPAVTSIKNSAFSNNQNMKRIIIPNSLTEILYSAFANCTNLTDVYYSGTEEDWAKIRIQNTSNDAVLNATIHYEEKPVTELTLDKVAATISKGESVQLAVNIKPLDATDKTINFSSSNDAVATVDENGVITGVSLGNATITANTGDGRISATCNVTVQRMVVGSGSCGDNVSWLLDGDGILTISGTGDMEDYMNYVYQPWFVNADKVTEVIVEEGVTGIGKNAFSHFVNLKKVELPDSLTHIGHNVFFECRDLPEINIPDGVVSIGDTAFSECDFIETVDLGKSLQLISLSMFADAYTLKTVFIPDTVTTIKDSAFFTTKALTDVYYNNTEEKWKQIVIEPRNYCLYDANIHYLTATGVCEDGLRWTLYDDGTLVISGRGDMPDWSNDNPPPWHSVADLVKAVIVEEKITSIGDYAFLSCDQMEKISFPESLESIGKNSFDDCSALETIEVDEANKSYSFADGVLFNKDKTVLIYYPQGKKDKSYSVPEGVIRIEDGAFGNWLMPLEKIFVPESITEIGQIFNEDDAKNVIFLAYDDTLVYEILREAEDGVSLGGIFGGVIGIKRTGNPNIIYGTSISGSVEYTDGSAAADVTVEILYENGLLKETVKTNSDGIYKISYAEIGEYTVRAIDAYGNTASETVAVKRKNSYEVFVSGTSHIVLKRGNTVSGTVSEGGTVILTDLKGNVIAETKTDGEFSLKNIPNGEYIIKAENENGMVTKEITVFNADVSGINLVFPLTTATVRGYVEVADREGATHRRNWVSITIYNSEGIAVANTRSDADGKYIFSNLPLGEYSLVAETSEMRPDADYGFERDHKLTGYMCINVTEAKTYELETIVLYEKIESVVAETITGKVTAHGETQDCEVIIKNIFGDEIAKQTTGNNGKYAFKNLPDGIYSITAMTKSDGMGYIVITVKDGVVYGDTDIVVYKSDEIARWESGFYERIPLCADRSEALQHKEAISAEKNYYDALSAKEKKQLSAAYTERLEKLCSWVAGIEVNSNDEEISVDQDGMIVSGDEIAEIDESESIVFEITVEKTDGYEASTDGVYTNDDFIYHEIDDVAGKYEIMQHYEITMEKTEKNGKKKQITDIQKDIGTNGKLRITMTIPNKYRGYKQYSVIHVHNGETIKLTDLDDNPDTITIEVDRFSTFVLAGTYDDVVDMTIVRPYTESDVTKTDSKILIDTAVYNIEEPYEILIIGYKNNQYVTMKRVLNTEQNSPYSITGDIDEIKIMVVDGLSAFKPLCNAEDIPNSKWVIQQSEDYTGS